jgi:hypothetical protein
MKPKIELYRANGSIQSTWLDTSNIGWCVLLHQPRPTGAPDETIFTTVPNDNAGVDGVPFQEWWSVSDRINPDPKAREWLGEYEKMFFNNDENPDVKVIDRNQPVNIRTSSSGGNLKAFYKNKSTSKYLKLVAFDYLHPEYADGRNFFTDPHMFTFPVGITNGGITFKVGGGLDVFVAQIERVELGLWVKTNMVNVLLQRPATWTIADVMKP